MIFYSDYNGIFPNCFHRSMLVKDLSELCYNITMNGGEKFLHYVMNQNKQVRTAVLESEKGYTVFYTLESKIQDLIDLKNEIEFTHNHCAMA